MNTYPIYCINLEHRKDRKEYSFTQFQKLDISHNKVIYPHFTKDKRGGAYGCFDSHMKVWNDFFIKHPTQNYCLIFEDDFVISKHSKSIMKQAVGFIEKNYENIDLIFLHNICVGTENEINNKTFTNGYGVTTHVYYVTRHYIQSIIKKHGKLPDANGNHVDFEINLNKFSENNWLYTEKIFFTHKECITQLDETKSKSDNYLNLIDSLFRQDIYRQIILCKKICIIIKKYNILNNDQMKKVFRFIAKIIT
jgi:GR25 family glycosyltransferase involved in LPS biosynthesis